ncbi:MAG: TraR/DksA family transcriptional regulator [Nitrospiraceae bacterium]
MMRTVSHMPHARKSHRTARRFSEPVADNVGKQEAATLRRVLYERRQETQKEIDNLILRRVEDQARLREDAVSDSGDLSIRDNAGDEQLSVLQVWSGMRDQLDAALHRLDEGSYGVCEDCEEAISAQRLKAIPFAKRCVACQEKVELFERIAREVDREEI